MEKAHNIDRPQENLWPAGPFPGSGRPCSSEITGPSQPVPSRDLFFHPFNLFLYSHLPSFPSHLSFQLWSLPPSSSSLHPLSSSAQLSSSSLQHYPSLCTYPHFCHSFPHCYWAPPVPSCLPRQLTDFCAMVKSNTSARYLVS